MIKIEITVDDGDIQSEVKSGSGACMTEIHAAIVHCEKVKLELIELLPKAQSFVAQIRKDDEP